MYNVWFVITNVIHSMSSKWKENLRLKTWTGFHAFEETFLDLLDNESIVNLSIFSINWLKRNRQTIFNWKIYIFYLKVWQMVHKLSYIVYRWKDLLDDDMDGLLSWHQFNEWKKQEGTNHNAHFFFNSYFFFDKTGFAILMKSHFLKW